MLAPQMVVMSGETLQPSGCETEERSRSLRPTFDDKVALPVSVFPGLL